jgi:Carboxypeptidase regulatory-like domain
MQARSSLVAVWALAVLVGNLGDRTTGQPLSGVVVTLGNVHATSHADGSFRLTGVKPGRATLSVSSDDVPPQQFPVTVGNTTTRVNLRVCSTTLDYNCGPPQ